VALHDDVVIQVRRRLQELEPAVTEHAVLERALAAILSSSTTARPARARRRGARPGTPRAPRGANQTSILRAVRKKPLTAGEIANATGIKPTTVSPTLAALVKNGKLTRNADRTYAAANAATSKPAPRRGRAKAKSG
jgi:DNA-binding transcriptional ArsR family regulator